MCKKSVLLVNKDPEILSAFSITLGEIGYDVEVALDKETALLSISKEMDLIIIDFTDEGLSPFEILDYYYKKIPDTPRIALFSKDMFDKQFVDEVYSKTFDIIVNPIRDLGELKRRVSRAIDNFNLIMQNKNYQSLLLDKNFKTGILSILSSMLNRFDNYIDQFLAEIYIWKEKIGVEIKNDKNLSDKFNEFVNLLKDKILNIEEIIQINDVLLNQNNSENGLDLNIIIEDIIKIMKYIFDKNFIEIELSLNPLKKTKIDSLKIVQCIYYVIENSIETFKYNKADKKILKINSKIIDNNEDTEHIEILFEDNCKIDDKATENYSNTADRFDTNNELFSLFDIKRYFDMISGNFEIRYSESEDFNRKTILKLPII